jgi:hypothetical protein
MTQSGKEEIRFTSQSIVVESFSLYVPLSLVAGSRENLVD